MRRHRGVGWRGTLGEGAVSAHAVHGHQPLHPESHTQCDPDSWCSILCPAKCLCVKEGRIVAEMDRGDAEVPVQLVYLW